MTRIRNVRPVAAAALAAAILAIPAVAQDVTLPQVTAPAPPAAAPVPVPAAPAVEFRQAPVVQNAPPPGPRAEDLARAAQEEAAATATSSRRTTRPTVATATRRAAAVPAPVAAAPVAAEPSAPASAPSTAQPAATSEPGAAPAEAPATQAAAPAENSGRGVNWLWPALGLLAVLGVAALLFGRRRRAVDTYDEDGVVYAEPSYAAAPIAYEEPVPPVADVVAVDDAPPAEVDAVLAAAPAVAGRPSIELGIRPLRVEESDGRTTIEVELTVTNAGQLAAQDVRVSAWLLDGTASEEERGLIEGATLARLDIAPGEGKLVDAVLTGGTGTARPVVVTDARYPLPDGSEGRLTASFEIDATAGMATTLYDLERA